MLDWETVRRGPVVSEDQARMDVDVDQGAASGVVAEPARRARYGRFRWWERQLEPEPVQRAVEPLRPAGVDEEIHVPGPSLPARPLPVPLPLTAHHTIRMEPLAETLEQARCLDGSGSGLADRQRHAVTRRAPASRMMRRASGSSGGSGKSRRPRRAVPSIHAVRAISARS